MIFIWYQSMYLHLRYITHTFKLPTHTYNINFSAFHDALGYSEKLSIPFRLHGKWRCFLYLALAREIHWQFAQTCGFSRLGKTFPKIFAREKIFAVPNWQVIWIIKWFNLILWMGHANKTVVWCMFKQNVNELCLK